LAGIVHCNLFKFAVMMPVIRISFLLICGLFQLPLNGADTTAKPNILLILADDLGYGDVQSYNRERGKILTPSFDQLAKEGMRFTDAHSSSGVCSPSRYTLLTGRYHWRSRLQQGIVGLWEEPLMGASQQTVGSLAKQLGYRTAAIGKWHLGWNWPITTEQRSLLGGSKKENANQTAPSPEHLAAWQEIFSKTIAGGPTARGFDYYFGTDVPNWPPYCFIENDRVQGPLTEFLPAKLLGNNIASKPGPARQEWKLEEVLPTLEERAVKFIKESAGKPEPFLLYLPLTSPHTPLSVAEDWKGKSGLNDYADFVMQTDATIGRVLQALQKSGAAENTLVIVTSDNGCAPYVGAKELEAKGHYPSGPLRGYKFSAWEGGHRVPFLVRWPGVIQPGAVCERLVHHADLLRTFAEIWQIPVTEDLGVDSFSLLPLLKGIDKPVREHAISASSAGIPALRQGSWKYIAGTEGAKSENAELQLYDLATDLGEMKNLAKELPDKLTAMQTLLEQLIRDGRSNAGPKQKNDVPVRRFPLLKSSQERSAKP
jgi:arylsulfatase A